MKHSRRNILAKRRRNKRPTPQQTSLEFQAKCFALGLHPGDFYGVGMVDVLFAAMQAEYPEDRILNP